MTVSGLDAIAVDLSEAGLLAGLRVRHVMGQLGEEIRDDARELAPGASGSGPARHYPAKITHEVDEDGMGVEIGPEKGGQGSLGHLFEYGVASRGVAPRPHLGPALDRAVGHAEDLIADAGRLW